MSTEQRDTSNVIRFRATIAGFVIAALLPGSAVSGEDAKQCEQTAAVQRQELNEGYSLLYSSLSTLQTTDKWLYTKVESDRVDQTVTGISDYAGKLHDDLERLGKAYPAIRLDLKPLPEMEQRKRELQSSDYLKSVAPVVGKTGPVFERTLLLTLSGALNQLRYKAQVMAEEESVPELRKTLKTAEQRFADLYEGVVKELNEDYFKDNTYSPPD